MTQIRGQERQTHLTLRQAVYNAVRLADAPTAPADVLQKVVDGWPQADELEVLGLLSWWTARRHMLRTDDGRYRMNGDRR